MFTTYRYSKYGIFAFFLLSFVVSILYIIFLFPFISFFIEIVCTSLKFNILLYRFFIRKYLFKFHKRLITHCEILLIYYVFINVFVRAILFSVKKPLQKIITDLNYDIYVLFKSRRKYKYILFLYIKYFDTFHFSIFCISRILFF